MMRCVNLEFLIDKVNFQGQFTNIFPRFLINKQKYLLEFSALSSKASLQSTFTLVVEHLSCRVFTLAAVAF